MYFNKHIEPSHVVENYTNSKYNNIDYFNKNNNYTKKNSNVLCHYYYLQLCHYRHYGKWHTVTALLL